MISRAAILITLLPVYALSQELEWLPMEPAKVAEELFAQQELDLNYEELYESVLQYLASPLDINQATPDELRSLFLLNDRHVNDLIAHRTINGSLLSIYELQSIASFDAELIRRLSPFVRVTSQRSTSNLPRRILAERNNYFLVRYERMLETKGGFDATDSLARFNGTPDKYFMRFRVSHPRDFSVGFTIEKDPGESSIIDYYSFHFQQSGGKRISNFIAGDFQAHFGQGLVMGGGFGMGKGAEAVLTVRRNTLGFIPWTSAGESGFFRGMGVSLAITKRLQLHSFVSRKLQDAIVGTALVAEEEHASLQTSGLHRNSLELSHQKTVCEYNAGLVLEYRHRGLQAGITSMKTEWDIPLVKGASVYNVVEPAGGTCTNMGAFVNYTIRNFNVFSEAAQSLNWGTGIVAGALISANKKVDMAFLARRYARDFWSPYGSAISENSTARNESGVYWGWKVQASRSVSLSGYNDIFHFPWLQFRAYSVSSTGHDALVRMTWKPRKDVSFVAQAREERKGRNTSDAFPVYHSMTGIRRNYCIAMDFSSATISMRTRVQGSTLRLHGRTGGLAISQDIGFDSRRFSIQVRHALFDTDDFDNRQYVYEPDMWMSYSFPAYTGVGVRTTAMLRLNLGKHADIWLRWARSRYEDREEIGSGRDGIAGSARNDLKAQVRIKL